MNNRTIFPGLALFKKTVTENFLVALREIYRQHPVYPYQDDRKNTEILIEPTYGSVSYEGKMPQMLVRVGQYRFSLQDTIDKNMKTEVRNDLGVIGGFKSQKDMSTTIRVFVRSTAEEEASDLADEVVMLAGYGADFMFTQMGIQVRDSLVGETTERDASNDLFETQIDFAVLVPWELSKVNKEDAIDPDTDIDLPWDFDPDEYRSPGAYVVHGRLKK